MKPPPFEYFAPETLEEALALLADKGEEATLLAGGQSLVPTLNFRLASPAVLIDLNRVADLFFIRQDASTSELRVGAMTRQRMVEKHPLVSRLSPLLAASLPWVAHPQIRNRGTIGGSIAHADPSAEIPAVMVAVGARFALRSQRETRWVAAEHFFEGMFSTVRREDEVLTEIAIPKMKSGGRWAFREVARRHGDYALMGVAAIFQLNSQGRCVQPRLTFLSAGPGVMLARRAAGFLQGRKLDPDTVAEAACIAAQQDVAPLEDLHASVAYRRHLAQVLARQTIQAAAQQTSHRTSV